MHFDRIARCALAIVLTVAAASRVGAQETERPDNTWEVKRGTDERKGTPYAIASYSLPRQETATTFRVRPMIVISCGPKTVDLEIPLKNVLRPPENEEEQLRILSDPQDRALAPRGKITLKSGPAPFVLASAARNTRFDETTYYVANAAKLMPMFATGESLYVEADSHYVPGMTEFPFDSITPDTLRSMFSWCRVPIPPGFRSKARKAN